MDGGRVQDLEQQISYLRWRRIQNEREIKNSLLMTNTMKNKDQVVALSMDKPAEKSLWMNHVVYDELHRPLVLTDEQVHNIQEIEHKTKVRFDKVTHQFSRLISFW